MGTGPSIEGQVLLIVHHPVYDVGVGFNGLKLRGIPI